MNIKSICKTCALLPLDTGGRFGGDIQYHAAGVGHFIDDALGDASDQIIG